MPYLLQVDAVESDNDIDNNMQPPPYSSLNFEMQQGNKNIINRTCTYSSEICSYIGSLYIIYITSIKNNCLMKSEVGMAVLKSKQTRVRSKGNHHICIVHPYACFSRQIM